MTGRFVVATSGHVDHGKSTLVRALTGIEPDRLAEERRRGLTIDLGFAWFELDSGRSVAFVDVPGHERFIGNMLAGLGPAPVVLFVVAADQGWQPQSTDHLAAAVALGIRHGVVALTRTDLADDTQLDTTTAQVRQQLAATALADVPIVPVCALDGSGLHELREALDATLAQLPEPDASAPIRMWLDRAFTISGAGTVVTGTLAEGALEIDQQLELWRGDADPVAVQVRGLQRGKHDETRVTGVSRVAVNLRGVPSGVAARGQALVTPQRWWASDSVDVRRVSGPAFDELPREVIAHLGTAAIAATVREFGAEHARLHFAAELPLQIGDRLVLRAPGAAVGIGGALVLDVDPPQLRRRGAGRRRETELAGMADTGSIVHEVARRGAIPAATVEQFGIEVPDELPNELVRIGAWLATKDALLSWARKLRKLVADDAAADPLSAGITRDAAVDALAVPNAELLGAVVRLAKLEVRDGRICAAQRAATLGPIEAAVAKLETQLRTAPFVAPDADTLAALKLGRRELAAAERAGRVLRIAEGIVLLPDAPARAAAILRELPQPFTVSEARQRLDTSRRVAVPLLELLDRRGLTRRVDDSRRTVR